MAVFAHGIGHGVVADCVERLTNLSIKEESHACVSLSVRVRVSMHTHVGACGMNVCEYVCSYVDIFNKPFGLLDIYI